MEEEKAKATTYRDAGKPEPAVPVATGCGKPAAFNKGPVYQTGPIPSRRAPLSGAGLTIRNASAVAAYGGFWNNDGTGHSFGACLSRLDCWI
jgi:hypothetical protein